MCNLFNLITLALFNRTTDINMTTSVSRRLNILYIMFKFSVFYIATLLTQLCVTHMMNNSYDPVNSLRGGLLGQ
jgi:hypothetical protein